MIEFSKGLKYLFDGLIISLPGIVNVTVLLAVFIFMFAVSGVFLFGNVQYAQCINRQCNFRNVGNAMMLLLRLTTDDKSQMEL